MPLVMFNLEPFCGSSDLSSQNPPSLATHTALTHDAGLHRVLGAEDGFHFPETCEGAGSDEVVPVHHEGHSSFLRMEQVPGRFASFEPSFGHQHAAVLPLPIGGRVPCAVHAAPQHADTVLVSKMPVFLWEIDQHWPTGGCLEVRSADVKVQDPPAVPLRCRHRADGTESFYWWRPSRELWSLVHLELTGHQSAADTVLFANMRLVHVDPLRGDHLGGVQLECLISVHSLVHPNLAVVLELLLARVLHLVRIQFLAGCCTTLCPDPSPIGA